MNSNFKYAFYTDGFMVSVPNSDDMEISLCYMNEQYYRLNGFELSQGTDLYFDYQLDGEIPVLIGKGLSKTYPVGATIKIEKSVLGRPLTLKVQGVLKQNAYHSNYYGCWLRKDATFATYGLFGLIGMDWLALLLVVASDVVIGMIVVESMLWKIKKVPISLGVLQ